MMRIFVTLLLIGSSLLHLYSIERGKATFYGKKFHGRKTASGERLDNNAPVAAHRTLDFGTWVRVTHTNTRSVAFVRIIDRGPFGRGRIIDVSYATAERLGMLQNGVADVELKVASEVDWAINTPPLNINPIERVEYIRTPVPETPTVKTTIPPYKKPKKKGFLSLPFFKKR